MWKSMIEQLDEFMAFTASYISTWVVGNWANWCNTALGWIQPIIEPVILNAVFWYNKQWVHIEHLHHQTYETNQVYQQCVNAVSYLCGAEPDEWIGVYGIRVDETGARLDTLRYQNHLDPVYKPWIDRLFYALIMPDEEKNTPVKIDADMVTLIVTQYKHQIRVQHTKYTPIVMAKWKKHYFCYMCGSSNAINIDAAEPSEVEFLCVEYYHPEMKTHITLNVSKSMMMVGNEILSSVFVLKLLEDMGVDYVLDSKYTLRIMDGDIHMFELGANQFVRLNKTGYDKIDC